MKLLPIAICLFFSSLIYAQEVVWTLEDLGKNANIVQTDDGMVLVSDKTSLRSVHPTTGAINWTLTDVKKLDKLSLMSNFPYLKNSGKDYSLIDSRDGTLISHHAEKTTVESLDELLENGKLLFNLKSGKKDVLEMLDLKSNKVWTTKIADKIKGGGLLGTYKNPKPIVTNTGKMVVFRKEAFHLIDINDGNIITQSELEKKYKLLAVTADKSAFLIHWDKKMLKAYSTETGKLLWETKNKNKNVDVINAGSTNNDWLLIDKKKYTIFNAQNGESTSEGKWKSEPNFFYTYEDRLFAGIKKELVEFNKTTLEIINSKSFDHDVKALTDVNNTILIETKYMNEIDLNTFELTYPYKTKLPFSIFDIIDIGNNVLYVNFNWANAELVAIGKDGSEQWNYKTTSASTPSIDILESGQILIISDTQMALLDAKSGKKVWDKNISVKPGFAYAFNESSNHLGIYNDNKVGFIDLNNGEKVMFDKKVKFKDFDKNLLSPTIAMLDDGIYLKGSNSIAFYDLDGNQVYNYHYRKSDITSSLIKLAGAAVAVGAIVSGNAGRVMTVTNVNTGEVIHQGDMVDDLNDNYAYSEQMAAKRQRNANRGSIAIPYVFSKLDNGDRALIFFDMKSGDEKYTITMTEKEPTYILDEYENMIFYKDTKAKMIKAFSLK